MVVCARWGRNGGLPPRKSVLCFFLVACVSLLEVLIKRFKRSTKCCSLPVQAHDQRKIEKGYTPAMYPYSACERAPQQHTTPHDALKIPTIKQKYNQQFFQSCSSHNVSRLQVTHQIASSTCIQAQKEMKLESKHVLALFR